MVLILRRLPVTQLLAPGVQVVACRDRSPWAADADYDGFHLVVGSRSLDLFLRVLDRAFHDDAFDAHHRYFVESLELPRIHLFAQRETRFPNPAGAEPAHEQTEEEGAEHREGH